jgi:hypothetical protein
MKRIMCVIWLSLTAAAACLQADDKAEAILKRAELVLYPDSFHVKNTLSATGPGKNPAPLVFDVLHKKDTGTVMEILSPARRAAKLVISRAMGTQAVK